MPAVRFGSGQHAPSLWNLIQLKRLTWPDAYLREQTSLGEMGGWGKRNPQKNSENDVEKICNDPQQKENLGNNVKSPST